MTIKRGLMIMSNHYLADDYTWLKLGDIEQSKIDSIINGLITVQDYKAPFTNDFYSRYNYRYMAVNNETAALKILEHTMYSLAPIINKMFQAEKDADPSYTQKNVDTRLDRDQSHTGTVTDTDNGTNNFTDTYVDTGYNNSKTYGKYETLTQDTSSKETTVTPDATSNGDTVTVEHREVTGAAKDKVTQKTKDTVKTTESYQDYNKDQTGTVTKTNTPAAETITKTVTGTAGLPNSINTAVSGFSGSAGTGSVVSSATPAEVASGSFSQAQESVTYQTLGKDAVSGEYTFNKEVTTYGAPDGQGGTTPFRESMNGTKTTTVEPSGNNTESSKVDTEYTNSKSDSVTIGGNTFSVSNMNEVHKTGYEDKTTTKRTQSETTTVTGKDTSNGQGVKTTYDYGTKEGTPLSNDTQTGTQSTLGHAQTTTNNSQNLRNLADTEDVHYDGYTVDRSTLTENYIKLLKNNKLFDYVFSMLENCFAAGYEMDYRDFWDVKEPLRTVV